MISNIIGWLAIGYGIFSFIGAWRCAFKGLIKEINHNELLFVLCLIVVAICFSRTEIQLPKAVSCGSIGVAVMAADGKSAINIPLCQ